MNTDNYRMMTFEELLELNSDSERAEHEKEDLSFDNLIGVFSHGGAYDGGVGGPGTPSPEDDEDSSNDEVNDSEESNPEPTDDNKVEDNSNEPVSGDETVQPDSETDTNSDGTVSDEGETVQVEPETDTNPNPDRPSNPKNDWDDYDPTDSDDIDDDSLPPSPPPPSATSPNQSNTSNPTTPNNNTASEELSTPTAPQEENTARDILGGGVKPAGYKEKPRYFGQNFFSEDKGFGKKFGAYACFATALLNEVSEEYTKKTGKRLTDEQAIEMMKAAIKAGGVLDDDKNWARVNSMPGALNAMSKEVGLEGTWSTKDSRDAGYAPTAGEHLIYVGNNRTPPNKEMEQHFVNNTDSGAEFFDPQTEVISNISSGVFSLDNVGVFDVDHTRTLFYKE